MKKLFGFLFVLALMVGTVPAFATDNRPPQPAPDCKWVDAKTEQVWVPPVTKKVVVVDKEAWDETVKGTCYPAETRTDTIDRDYDPTTYKCPDGFTDVDGVCTKVTSSDRPYTIPYTCPGPFTFTASHLVCPEGYSPHGQTCRKWEVWHYHYADKVTETFSVTFSYDKDESDKLKCHRPDDGEDGLHVPSWAQPTFKQTYSEWLVSIPGDPEYGVCPLPSVVDPLDSTKCLTTTTTDKIEDHQGHYLSCPADYSVGPTEDKCTRTVVVKEAYCDPDTVIHHDAVTHEEEVVVEPGYFKTVVIEEGYWDCPIPVCEYNPQLPPNDPLCKPPKECKLEPQYYQFTIHNEGQSCTLVSWDTKDEIGKPDEFWIPNAIRQLCNCGFVAESKYESGWVYKDSCTGEYTYLGKHWGWFKEDLLTPHWEGTCGIGGC